MGLAAAPMQKCQPQVLQATKSLAVCDQADIVQAKWKSKPSRFRRKNILSRRAAEQSNNRKEKRLWSGPRTPSKQQN
eukprot:scaffold246828_cov15-Prasinocladus_malaysianus.AAC.1